jgi:hypothetical protein
MKKTLSTIIIAASLAFTAAPALAGDGHFVRASDGFEIKIKCRNSGCTVTGKQPGGKWGRVEKGPGGTENYELLVTKYAGMGFAEK